MDRWQSLFWGSFVPLVVIQGFVLINGRYWTLTLADIVLHFMWGLSIFLFFISYLRWQPKDALLGVIVWQAMWEAAEIIGDWLLNTATTSLHHDPFFFDGISDTLVNIGGGLVGWLLVYFTGAPLYERRMQKLRAWFVYTILALIPLIIIGAPIAVVKNDSLSMFAAGWILIALPLTGLYALLKEPKVKIDRRAGS